MRRRLARVAEWLAVRVAPRVDPAWLAAAERARIERVAGRPLEPQPQPRRFDTRDGVLCASKSFIDHAFDGITKPLRRPGGDS